MAQEGFRIFLTAGFTAQFQRHQDILKGRERRDELEALEDEANQLVNATSGSTS